MQKKELEVDVGELFKSLWEEKIVIVGITTLFIIIAVVYALSKPNIYRAETLLVPVSDKNQISNLASQLGGLASFAGINLGGKSGTQAELALKILESRQFSKKFIEEHDILVPLMALKSWDSSTLEHHIDEELYDINTQTWIRKVKNNKLAKPSDWEAHKEFNLIVDFEQKKSTGFIVMSVESKSPILAQQWANWLVSDLNHWMREEDIEEYQNNIAYLEDRLEKTLLTDMQKVFYQLIEEQIKKLMLAEVKDEYVLKVVDPAVLPEEKYSPRRAVICILGAFIGGIFSLIVAAIRIARRSK